MLPVASLILLAFLLPAQAHNGQMALALPMEAIVVDGDLSDWPPTLDRYPLTKVASGDAPTSEADFKGDFRIAYHPGERALYIAVEVQDQSVLDTYNHNWNTQDGCEIYLYAGHRQQERKLVQHMVHGDHLVKNEKVQVEMRRTQGGHQYEWRLDLAALGQQKTQSGSMLGLDVVVSDRDADSSFSWVAWGPGTRKYDDILRTGDLVLLTNPDTLGTLTGQVNNPSGAPFAGITVQAYRDQLPMTSSLTDAAGRYRMRLLPGEYSIQPGLGELVQGTRVEAVRIKSDQENQADLSIVPLPALVRLAFWVPPEQRPAFAKAYRDQLGPILKRHGLVAVDTAITVQSDSVFSRFFEMRRLDKIDQRWQLVQADPAFVALRQRLVQDLSAQQLPAELTIYSTPAISSRVFAAGPGTAASGSGKVVAAGFGNRQGVWHNYDGTDGLASPLVSNLLQDQSGQLWISTYGGGVSRFDGIEFTTFTTADGLADNTVYSIIEDRQGQLWFATNKGVSRYDGSTFTTFTTADGLSHNRVSWIVEDGLGQVWLGTYWRGVCRYDGTSFTAYDTREGFPSNHVTSATLDRAGHLWLGGGHQWLGRYDGKRFTFFGAADGLPPGAINAVFADRAGLLWIATENNGLTYFDGTTFSAFEASAHLVSQTVRSLTEDSFGHLWFAGYEWSSGRGGLSRYDGQSVISFTSGDGLVSNFTHSVTTDREGHLWIGTGGGISRYDGQSFRTFNDRDGLAVNRLGKILEDRQGRFWFTSALGLIRFDGTKFDFFDSDDGLVDNNIVSLFADQQDHLWIGSYDRGVSRWDGQRFTNYTIEDGLGSDWVFSIAQDRAGRLWFANWNGGGLTCFDSARVSRLTRKDGLPSNNVRAVLVDRQDQLWIATQDGLSHYDGAQFKTFTTADGLVDNDVRSLHQDSQGNLWCATQSGVSRYDGASFKTFTAATGLANDQVNSIMEDNRGHIWFATSGGITRYDGTIFQSLLRRDGLPDNIIMDIHQSANGDVWITTHQGLTRYRSHALPPRIRLANVSAGRSYGALSELSLPQTDDPLEFEFRGISLKTLPDKMVYLYRLEGVDQDWQQTRQTRVVYPALPRGRYLFQVKAVDRDLVYSPEAAQVVVNLHFPYRKWALGTSLGLALLVAIAAVGYGGRRRFELRRTQAALLEEKQQRLAEQQIALQEKELAQEALIRSESMAAIGTLVAGAAHELNNPLGAAASLVQTVQEIVEEDTAEELEQDREMIIDNLAFSRKELNRAKEIVASLLGLSRQSQNYTEQVDLNEVVSDALRVLSNKYKQYEVDISEDYQADLPILQGNFAQLGQVCINLIENGIEAFGDKEAKIQLSTFAADGKVVFECRDFGPGMSDAVRQDIFKPFFTTKAPGEGTGLGLYVCHQIIEKHGGRIEVESQLGKGTAFKVHLPAEKA